MKKISLLCLSAFLLGCAAGSKPLSVDQISKITKIGTVSVVPENYRYYFIGGTLFKSEISVRPTQSFNDRFNQKLIESLSAKNKSVSKVNIDQVLLEQANQPGFVSLKRSSLSTEKSEKMILEYAKLQGFSHVITVFGFDNESPIFTLDNGFMRYKGLKGGLGLRCSEGVFRGIQIKDNLYASVVLSLWDVNSGKIIFNKSVTPEGNAWTGKINSPLWVQGQTLCNELQNQESVSKEFLNNETVFQGFITYAVDEFLKGAQI